MDQCLDVNQEFTNFAKANNKTLGDMRDEFRNKANQLTAHHAALMKKLRFDYAEELDAVKKVRLEINDFQVRTDGFCQELSESLANESRRIDALHRELRRDIDEMHMRRKTERTTLDSDLRDMKRDQSSNKDMCRALRTGVEYLGRLVGLVIESERLASAMLVQDFTDRSGEKWLGMPTDSSRTQQPSVSADDLLEQRRGGLDGDHRHARPSPVSVDWRRGLLLDTYLPGQVSFQGACYERRDILLLHDRLLQKALAAYQRGPLGEESVSLPISGAGTVAFQPGAHGVAAADKKAKLQAQPMLSASKVAELQELPKDFGQNAPVPPHSASSFSTDSRRSSRQRPGSQGLGSRGAMLGPLGETEPVRELTDVAEALADAADALARIAESKTPPLKLPSIASDGGMSVLGSTPRADKTGGTPKGVTPTKGGTRVTPTKGGTPPVGACTSKGSFSAR